MKTLRFGIIGTGNIAPIHAAAIKSVADAELVAVADGNCGRAESFAQRYSVDCEKDYHRLCARADVDIITICAPHHLHAPMTVEAAKAGKHIMCEKPMACTPEECDRMIAACHDSGVTLDIIFQNRFDCLPGKIKAAVDTGRLGQILWVSSTTPWYRDTAYYREANWRGAWATAGGGALINQAIHAVDLLLWLGGDPQRVTAKMRTLNHSIEVEDSLVALLEYPAGHLGMIQATTNAYPGFAERLEFHGTRGSVIYHKGEARLEWHLRDPDQTWEETTETSNAASAPMDISAAGHIAQFRDFAAALREGRSPSIGPLEGRRSVDLIAAVYSSARSDIPVELGTQ